MASVEVTVMVEAIIKVEHDGPTEGLRAEKYDTLVKQGIWFANADEQMKLLSQVFGSGREVDLGYVDDDVSYMATEVLDATVIEITKVEKADGS